jgi:hypothetical protein
VGDVRLLQNSQGSGGRTGNSVGIVFAGTYGRCSVFDIFTAQLLLQFE